MTLPFDLERLCGEIALLDRRQVHDEGSGVEVVRPDVIVFEAIHELHPSIECVNRASPDISGLRARKVLPFVEALARMGHKDLWGFLKVGRDGAPGAFSLGRQQVSDYVAPHKKIDPAKQQQQSPVGLWTAGNDGDVEPVVSVGAVGYGLKESARL